MATKERRVPRARRDYTDEFKAGAVRLVLDEGKTLAEVARDLDLTASALNGWAKRARANRSGGKTGPTSDQLAELATLKKELRVVTQERDILKKAVAFFAKENT
jgi:transposase